MLQNHPGLRRFPTNWRDMMPYLQHGSPALRFSMIVLLVLSLMAVPLFGVIMFSGSVVNGRGFAVAMVLGLFAALVSGGFAWTAHCYLHTLRREQQRYHRLAATPVLSDRQRQALCLDAVGNYFHGQWSETLEYWPLWSQLPSGEKFLLLPLKRTDTYQRELFNSWGISRTQDYVDALCNLRKGMHTPGFASALSPSLPAGAREAMAQHLAFLTEIPAHKVLASVETQADGRPPSLIWGFDLWRAIWLSRSAFMAGYITAEQAWSDLLATADQVHEIFASHKDFADSYRLGNAFWSNDYDMCKERRNAQRTFEDYCDWPVARLPWPQRPGLPLSDDIRKGFQQVQRRLQLVQSPPVEPTSAAQPEHAG